MSVLYHRPVLIILKQRRMEELFSMERPCTVLIVELWALIRSGVKQILESQNEPVYRYRVLLAQDASEAIRKLTRNPVDIVLMGDNVQIGGTPLLIKEMLKVYPDLRILVMADLPLSNHVKAAQEAGALGYLHKNLTHQDLLEAIWKTYNGNVYYSSSVANRLLEDERMDYETRMKAEAKLSNRELQVLRLIASGMTTPQISVELSIGRRTAETYRKNLLQKTRTQNAPGLVRYAFTNKLL
ncbi:LuxR C-terminal-related transcriptional regulator [Dinghuibacter silviterrae]|uniref:NarL family two-component system response regulator LiaR n=1 Tax=Dinghuibacter silviterrae TaxID=1539049 RepID=A0A4R8DF00_9BACT|nr:response regulator transcription factor [Dinghuibacter silviterrae]TDW96153.1 NarL family two-component system response regulator LiaR [Dinghuibacter silviterrae]